jgi:hypothetical protein
MLATGAVIGGTAAVTSKAMNHVMSSAGKNQAASTQQSIADLQAQQAELAAQQQMLAEQQALAQPTVASQAAVGSVRSSLDDQLLQIQKLSVMKAEGLITEEEFQAKKKIILGI